MDIMPNNKQYADRNNKFLTFAENSIYHFAIIELIKEANRQRNIYEAGQTEAASIYHMGGIAIDAGWKAEHLFEAAAFLSKK